MTLLDGSPNPGGLSAGWRTPQGRSVEAGVKGFWYSLYSKLVSAPECMCAVCVCHQECNSRSAAARLLGECSAIKFTPRRDTCTMFCRYQYANIFALVRELGLRDVFTRFTPSGFWSPSGLTTQVITTSAR